MIEHSLQDPRSIRVQARELGVHWDTLGRQRRLMQEEQWQQRLREIITKEHKDG